MISTLFKRKPKAAVAARPQSAPEGTVVWAVGDIHGCLELLEKLVEAIVHDAMASTAQRKVVIFLGDYLDRGPDSAACCVTSSIFRRTAELNGVF